MIVASSTTAGGSASPSYSLWQLVRYMLALGTWGFGGPAAAAELHVP
jgi:chromate transporter